MITTIAIIIWSLFLVAGLASLVGAYFLDKAGEPTYVLLFLVGLYLLMIAFFPITIVWFLVDRYQYQKAIKRNEEMFRASRQESLQHAEGCGNSNSIE